MSASARHEYTVGRRLPRSQCGFGPGGRRARSWRCLSSSKSAAVRAPAAISTSAEALGMSATPQQATRDTAQGGRVRMGTQTTRSGAGRRGRQHPGAGRATGDLVSVRFHEPPSELATTSSRTREDDFQGLSPRAVLLRVCSAQRPRYLASSIFRCPRWRCVVRRRAPGP